MKIEIISGSPRINSITRRVSLHLQRVLSETTDHEIGLIDLKDWDLPLMQPVFTSIDNTPNPWKPLSERIFTADAFILISPEYNGSYSPAMKKPVRPFSQTTP